MKTKTKIHGILKNLIIIFILIGTITTVSGYEDVDLTISFDDSSIKPGDDAILIVEIKNREDDSISVDIEIWDGDEDEKLEDSSASLDVDETIKILEKNSNFYAKIVGRIEKGNNIYFPTLGLKY